MVRAQLRGEVLRASSGYYALRPATGPHKYKAPPLYLYEVPFRVAYKSLLIIGRPYLIERAID